MESGLTKYSVERPSLLVFLLDIKGPKVYKISLKLPFIYVFPEHVILAWNLRYYWIYLKMSYGKMAWVIKMFLNQSIIKMIHFSLTHAIKVNYNIWSVKFSWCFKFFIGLLHAIKTICICFAKIWSWNISWNSMKVWTFNALYNVLEMKLKATLIQQSLFHI